MNDVASLAGVSLKTVSNVVNKYPHVSHSTREKVEQAIDQLGYSVNASARSLRSGRSGLVTLAIPELTIPYFAELAQSVTGEAERRDLRILLEVTGGDPEREQHLLANHGRSTSDALIYSPLGLTQKDVALISNRYPTVLLGERIFGAGTDHVTMSNVEASRAATEYLISTGARRIALLGYVPEAEAGSGSLRFKGYSQALLAAGMPVQPELLLSPAHPWWLKTGAEAVEAAIRNKVEFDAVFAMNDVLAIGAMRALHSHHIDVPGQVQVMGFDDIAETAYTVPALSTVNAGREEIAVKALDFAESRVDGSAPEGHRIFKAPFSLVLRESTLTL